MPHPQPARQRPSRRPSRPVGQPTRGKTAHNRLRQVDVYVSLVHGLLLSPGAPLVVDVGFGALPWTTLEMADRWGRINPRLQVVGVEIDPDRVNAAQPFARAGGFQAGVIFQPGGFNVQEVIARLPAETDDRGVGARIIRCYNVLRQYDETGVPGALAEMGAALEPGGLIIEGTSNPTGRMVAFDVYQRTDQGLGIPPILRHVALVFGTSFRDDLTPTDFQTILPRRLIHHALDPRPAAFFDGWRRALGMARAAGFRTVRGAWCDAARRLAGSFPIDTRERIIRRGYLAVFDPLLPVGG